MISVVWAATTDRMRLVSPIQLSSEAAVVNVLLTVWGEKIMNWRNHQDISKLE